ncbi:MAG: tetratricopeptide repeat protein, partial [Candidatus Hydrogenedentes bacterium]|nr:tetratricopeptide repeat protein [Candidatus Hydrogenedentota bacterium]
MSSSRLYSILGFFAILVAVPVVVATEVAAPADASTPAEMQLDFANGLFRDGFFEEAVEEYEKYLAASPQAPAAGVAWYRLGEAAYAAKQYEKALEALTKAAELAPDDETKQHASLSRGEVLYFLKRHPEAETVLAALAAPEVLPEMRGRALYFGGKASQTQQRYDAAEKSYRSLLDALPEHALAPYARYELALVMLAMNDLEKAAV